jgi:hypothetical protein
MLKYTLKILWLMDPILDKDLETNNETTAVTLQQIGKHASTTIELLLEMMFSFGPCKVVMKKRIGASSSVES